MDIHKTVSLSDQVFERLETDILTGKYPHGTNLTESDLVTDLGVSRTPVREAIVRLEQEGLLSQSAKGIEIIGITDKDVADIFEIRLCLEGLAAGKTAERITDEQLVNLKNTLDLQEFYFTKKDAANIREQDSNFHDLIYEYCGSPVFCELLRNLHKKVQRYRLHSVADQNKAKISVMEHQKILDAIKDRDADRAKAEMEKHVLNARKRILGD